MTVHNDLIQGSEEWLAARCGLLTASEMKLIVTPPQEPAPVKLKKNGEPYKEREQKPADNEKMRAHMFELAAQRITRYVEPTYISNDMLRGQDDEIEARALYSQHYAPVQEAGFITNDKWGFTIGYSPDGMVGEEGLIEAKSRRQKFQVETMLLDTPPVDYVIQLQTGLLVTERAWLDFISYSGGLPMVVLRVFPDPKMQAAIVEAASGFEERIVKKIAEYHRRVATRRLVPTERKIVQEMFT